MFYLIEPQEHQFYQTAIKQFLMELQSVAILETQEDTTKATFLLVTEDTKGVSGGLLLLKQSIKWLPSSINAYCSQCQEIWRGMITFQMSEALTGREFEKISKGLYQALYEDLIVFCIKEGIPLLWLSMPLIEHLSLEVWGHWPSLVGLNSIRSDKVFHKILRLREPCKEGGNMCKYDKDLEDPEVTSPVFPPLSAQNRNKIITIQDKIKPIFTP